LYRESQQTFEVLGDRWGRSHTLASLGTLAADEGEDARAIALLEESLAVSRELGEGAGVAAILRQLGLLELRAGHRRCARVHLDEGLTILVNEGNIRAATRILGDFAHLAAIDGRRDQATSLAEVAWALREATGGAVPWTGHALAERRLKPGRGEGGRDRESVWVRGRRMTFDEAVALAHEVAVDANTLASSRQPSSQLTVREREVAALIARGLTNRQIAATLVIAEGTAGNHVEHILAKLGYRSRAEVASWATARGLVEPSIDREWPWRDVEFSRCPRARRVVESGTLEVQSERREKSPAGRSGRQCPGFPRPPS
jgi:non-specific serine/threonine protein kinase